MHNPRTADSERDIAARFHRSGFRVQWAHREDALDFGYLGPYDVRDYPYEGTVTVDGQLESTIALRYVDMSHIARSEGYQSYIHHRSNYRRLREDNPDIFVDVSYSNCEVLGAFIDDLSDELIETLIGLAVDYPYYDEEDVSSLESDETYDSVEQYALSDITGEWRGNELAEDAWDALTTEQREHLFHWAMRENDYYPMHNGLDVEWEYKEFAPTIVDILMSARDGSDPEDLRNEFNPNQLVLFTVNRWDYTTDIEE